MGMVLSFAHYEFVLLLRSLVFRIFAFIVIAAQAGATAVLYFNPEFLGNWSLRAVPSAIPYTAVLLFDVLVLIGGIPIVTGFLHRDLIRGAADAVYYRDFPTPVYAAGKGIAILGVFFALEAVVLAIPFTATLFFITDTPVSISGYLLYPIVLTLPVLLFMTGVSWVLMLGTKNQPVTFLFGIILFAAAVWSRDIVGFHHLTDFAGLRVPALYSAFTGFGDVGQLLMQRGMFAALGVGLMAVAALMLPRLPQSRRAGQVTTALASVTAVIAIIAAGTVITGIISGKHLRDDMRVLNHEYGSLPRVTMTSCDLTVVHRGSTIQTEAALRVSNDTNAPLDTWLFSLNPGLRVTDVTTSGGFLEFSRDRHLLTVIPRTTLAPGDTATLVIVYEGTIDENACYIDIPETERSDWYPIAFMTARQMYGTIETDCVLLTPETLWYPVAGVPCGSTFPDLGKKDFPEFTLTVETAGNLTPISQGKPETLPDGRTRFRPETPLPSLSLAIAGYEHISADIDSITFSVYYLTGHDYFAPYLEDFGDKIPEEIQERLSSMENTYLRDYPFAFYTAVEVPIQFCPPDRIWTLVQDTIQPGMVLVGEKGTFMQDLRRLRASLQENLSPDQSTDQYNDTFTYNTLRHLANQRYPVNATTLAEQASAGGMAIRLMLAVYPQTYLTYYPFPNFYSFAMNTHSPRWPVIDAMMERYLALQNQMTGIVEDAGRFGIQDVANMLLAEQAMPAILSSTTNRDIVSTIMSSKMQQLFISLESRTGEEEFRSRLRNTFERSSFATIDLVDLLTELAPVDTDSLTSYLDDWYGSRGLPICRVCTTNHTEVAGSDRHYYKLVVTLANPGSLEGLFRIDCQTMGEASPGESSSSETFERYTVIPAGESRQVSILGDDPFYGNITLHSYLSGNLPSEFIVPVPEPVYDPDIQPFDGIVAVIPDTISTDPSIIIVDDTDPGCIVDREVPPSFIERLLARDRHEDLTFVPVEVTFPPDHWQRTFASSFYGGHIRSALFKGAGTGDLPVVWQAEIPEEGTYDIYTNLSPTLGIGYSIMVRGESKARRIVDDFHYIIVHANGEDTVEVNVGRQHDGWIRLGSYFFEAGTASVLLSDETDGRIVYADAIKWIRQ